MLLALSIVIEFSMLESRYMKEKLVVIGNGMAGIRTVEELLKVDPDAYEITVFGAEPYGNYNRIMLSPMLTGETTLDEIMLNPPEWYAQNNITLHTGKQVVKIDRTGGKLEKVRPHPGRGQVELLDLFGIAECDGVADHGARWLRQWHEIGYPISMLEYPRLR